MRIAMIYTNRNRYLCPAPVGALHVAGRLERDGHRVDFVDLMHAGNPEKALAAALAPGRHGLVCMSIRNVDNMQMGDLDRPLERIAGYSALARERAAAPVLIGGTAVTTFPAQMRRKLGADWAFAGDDVGHVSRFVSSVAAGAPDLDVPGLVYEDAGVVHTNPHRIHGYSGDGFSGWERIDLRKYRRTGHFDCGVVTCTGCPHGCSFCDSHRSFGREHVPRDPGAVVTELRELAHRHRARSVFLINTGINQPIDHGKELLRRLAEARLSLSFTCIIEPGPMDAEFARLLYRANCSAAMIFGSSLDDAVLERNQPHYRSADVIRIARLLGDADVPYMLGLMFGAPGETLGGIERTLDATLGIRPVMLITGMGLRIQPDTPLRETAIAEGAISADDDLFEARFYMSPGSPAGESARLLSRFKRRHPLQRLRMIPFMARMMKEGLLGRGGRLDPGDAGRA